VAIDQDGSGELSPQELQSALMNDGGLKFSISTVKYLMSVFDFDNSRGIGFQEFEALWNYVTVRVSKCTFLV
jgi:Ca2+-binding EF-hand superfamily protein